MQADDAPGMSSKQLLQKHMAFGLHDYDAVHERLQEEVERRFAFCAENSSSLQYDLLGIENWLADAFFSNMCLVRLDLEFVHYANENAASDALSVLRGRIRQVALPKTIADRIRLTASTVRDAKECIQEFNKALGIMLDVLVTSQATRLNSNSDLSSCLLLRRDCFAGACMKHADAVYSLLQSCVDASEFGFVNDKYKARLSGEADMKLKEATSTAAASSSLMQLQCIAKVCKQLLETHLGAGAAAIDQRMTIFNACISEHEDDLDDCDACELLADLVQDIRMENFIVVYEVLRHLAEDAQ